MPDKQSTNCSTPAVPSPLSWHFSLVPGTIALAVEVQLGGKVEGKTLNSNLHPARGLCYAVETHPLFQGDAAWTVWVVMA